MLCSFKYIYNIIRCWCTWYWNLCLLVIIGCLLSILWYKPVDKWKVPLCHVPAWIWRTSSKCNYLSRHIGLPKNQTLSYQGNDKSECGILKCRTRIVCVIVGGNHYWTEMVPCRNSMISTCSYLYIQRSS